MGIKFNPQENELYKKTDEVLFYIWDPIGISNEPYARDEYYSYLPHVFQMLIDNEPKASIVNYLLTVVSDNMGISPDVNKTEEVVQILFGYKNKIFDTSC